MIQELVPHLSCLCSIEEFPEVVKGTYSEIYTPSSQGKYMKHVKLSGGRSVRIEVDKLPVAVNNSPLITLQEELNFLPAGKIPAAYFDQIVEFFRQVSKKLKSDFEAHAWILWTKELGYFISIPKQSVSKAAVHFTYDDESLPPGSVIVCDIHSHNTMGAFWSGTDNNNDKSGIYYSAVVGKLTDDSFEHVIRFNLYEQKKICTLDEVFDIQKKTVEIPKDWLDQVDIKTYAPTVIPGGNQTRFTTTRSLWDQTTRPGGALPLGFQEIPANEVTTKGRGGKQRKAGKSVGREDGVIGFDDLPQWPNDLLEDADTFVAGPLDFTGVDPLTGELMGFNTDPDLGDSVAAEYGPEAVEAHQMIDDFLINLENCDKALLDIISQCYAMLTSAGQTKINMEGIQ